MQNNLENLCEIIFTDHKSGYLTSRIGMIDEFQLRKFSEDSNKFIIFKEKYNPPILKSDIEKIIIYRDKKTAKINKADSRILNLMKSQNSGKIS